MLLLAGAATGGVALWRHSQKPPVALDDAEEEAPAVDPGYVGPDACAACHAARVAQVRQTRHFRACCPPQEGTTLEGFAPGRGSHQTHYPGIRFEMTQAGGEFLHTAVRDTPRGEERSSSRIELVYGAGGHLDEVFFTWQEDRLFELPVAWLHPQGCWGNTSLSRHATGHFGRPATTRCVECHNTYLPHVPGSANQYRRDNALLGVTCERCHGPGRDHVAYHQAHPGADTAHAVVHPRRLSRERKLEVCTQCHSNTPKPRKPAFSYRPGEPLEDYYRTAVSRHPEDDHVANQIHYLRQSKCFQKSETLTCVSCHDPHRPTNVSTVRRSCLKCHQPADCGEQPRLPASVRSDCVGCHMPPRVWMNVHFHTQDDQFVPPIRRYQHRIAVYPEARQEVLLGWYRTQTDAHSRQEAARLTQALVKHWLAEAETRRRDHRFLAAIGALREALRLDPAPATRDQLRQVLATQAGINDDLADALHHIDQRRYPQAVDSLNRVLSVKPDHALAHGKLGLLLAMTGKNDQAVEHLEAVARHDPNDAYGHNLLGWLAYLQDRPEDAVHSYRRALEVEPFSAELHYRNGLALVKLGRVEDAVASFRQALAIDPQSAGSCQGLCHALREQGQPAEALPFARRAARLTRFQNPDILVTLADTYADCGRLPEARDTAAKALEAAQSSNPEMVPLIRRRLEEWQAGGR